MHYISCKSHSSFNSNPYQEKITPRPEIFSYRRKQYTTSLVLYLKTLLSSRSDQDEIVLIFTICFLHSYRLINRNKYRWFFSGNKEVFRFSICSPLSDTKSSKLLFLPVCHNVEIHLTLTLFCPLATLLCRKPLQSQLIQAGVNFYDASRFKF